MSRRPSHVTPKSVAEDRRQLEAWKAKQAKAEQPPEPPVDTGGESNAASAPEPSMRAVNEMFYSIFGAAGRAMLHTSGQPRQLAQQLATPPSGPELMKLQREEALASGGGKISGPTNVSHGTFAYALLYLEWEGLLRRTEYQTGPLPMDREWRFTLTAAGEKAREQLLRVTAERPE